MPVARALTGGQTADVTGSPTGWASSGLS